MTGCSTNLIQLPRVDNCGKRQGLAEISKILGTVSKLTHRYPTLFEVFYSQREIKITVNKATKVPSWLSFN